MRDLMMLAMMLIIVPLGLRNAFGAYVLWGWSGLIAIQTFAYGFMVSFPFVLLFAAAAMILILLRRDAELRNLKWDGVGLLLVWFGLHTLLCATLAYPNLARNWEIAIDLQKTLLFALVMPALVHSRLRLHAMVLMLALSSGYHGLIEGLKFVGSGGIHLSQGNAKLGDRNHFAVLVTMCLPFLLYLFWYSKNRIVRNAFLGALVVNVLSVVSTQSRGGLISLLAVALVMVVQSSRKVLGIFTIVLVGTLGVAMAPDSWTNRMESIQTANEDSSFMGRVIAWKRSSAIAVAHPFFGGGIRAVQDPVVYQKYRYEPGLLGWLDTPQSTYPAAAHSIFFEILGDMGFLGLSIFLLILASPFVMAARVKRLAARLGPQANWSKDLANAICAGMLGYIVGGASISAAYFEMGYIMVALAAVNYRVIRQQYERAFGADRPYESRAAAATFENGPRRVDPARP